MKRLLYVLLLCCMCTSTVFLHAQEVGKGCILAIEGEQVYVDLTSSSVKPGDILTVFSGGGYFIHPVTGKKIQKEEERVAALEVLKTYDSYSVAKAVPSQALSKLSKGLAVRAIKEDRVQDFSSNYSVRDDKVSVVVAPAQVNDVVGVGYFGTYVSDILMEQLMMCNKVKLLDRTVLGAQMDEVNLTGGYIDPSTAIQRGKIAGAQYIVQVTMQKPDVVNVRTGIPLASVMGAIQGATGKNIGAQYMSDMQVGTLKASVSITARVVDLQTGEVMFMCSGTGKSKGKSQLSMEYGALGGAQLNGGADGFKQTVTGKAIQNAFMPIGRNLNNYFNGNTDRRVVGSTSGFGNYNQDMRVSGMRLYMGTEKLDKEAVKMALAEQPQLYFQYKRARRVQATSWIPTVIGVSMAMGLSCITYDARSIIPGGIIGLAGISTSIYMQISSRKKVQSVACRYNMNNQYQSMASCNFGFSFNDGGVGLRLVF